MKKDIKKITACPYSNVIAEYVWFYTQINLDRERQKQAITPLFYERLVKETLMKYKVDGWNNFCRVFELPKEYPNDFCFGGDLPVNFQMVDWFCLVPKMTTRGISKEKWVEKFGPIEEKDVEIEKFEVDLIHFLRQKKYVKKGQKYLVIYEFGGSSTFDG